MDYAYCVIKCKENDLALDISGANGGPGASIILWSRTAADNQIWYQDPASGTIRSKMNDFCIDVEDGKVVSNPFNPCDKNQQWEFHKSTIRNRFNHDQVLGSCGSCVSPCDYDRRDSQVWDFELIGGFADHKRPKQFYIVSEMNGKVLDIEKASTEDGTKVIMYKKSSDRPLNQLWYFDYFKNIRSALNNMVFYSKESGKKLKTDEYHDSKRHQWTIDGNKIVNGESECLDIRGADNDDGAHVCSYAYNGHSNQHWRLEF